ncbi:YidC/Oxa1 family membrane protein insertase [Methylohalomonas lacus]|uniref:Membrane protein insertase YidC n=1 Tax=Methylohalomonas lacus TaxID=398773 RepID=A0AAE3L4A3_9GAMM|nr:YidC/Oxa1 family insertase periplasmic-domain containing protein [Methylohalomonas lacus]MCS3903563.1 YidC/Oxa1 family membrane protein insertase [Methylohalomonas lacus]
MKLTLGGYACLVVTFMIFVTLSAPGKTGNAALLEAHSLNLGWEDANSAITEWQVQSGESEWVSLVTRDAPASVISRHLLLEGFGSAADGSWKATGAGLTFNGTLAGGRLSVRQTLAPVEGEYRLRYRVHIENVSSAPLRSDSDQTLRLHLGPGLGEYPTDGYGIADTLYSFVEPVVSIGKEVRRMSLQEAGDTAVQDLADPEALDWAGLHSRYFALVVAPERGNGVNAIDVRLPDEEAATSLPPRYLPSIVLQVPTQVLKPQESVTREFLIFSGPKSGSALAEGVGDFSGLSFAGMWNWLRGLCICLLTILGLIHSMVPNWGISIILLAVLVRLALYPIAQRAMASQHAFSEVQKTIQPELRDIKNNYRGEEQSERILALYQRYSVSPLAGLKPLLIVLIQIPVFVALFHVLGQAYELRATPFLWIESLAEPDRLFSLGISVPYFGSHFNLLPILLAFTTLLTIKMAPAPAADESARYRQNIFLVIMALGFLVLFYPFPSGMVLYWTVANLLHLAQQYIVEH